MFTLSLRNAFNSSTILANQIANRQVQPGTLEHRRYIYAQDLYVLPCGTGITSRRREANSRFFRQNPACTHRLIPFLHLELRALIHNLNERNILMQLILKSLPNININSSRFQQLISQFTVHRTVHFIHELYNFAISTFDNLNFYYENAVYVPRTETTVVTIDYSDNDLFDLSDPYNYRISRGIYSDLNDNVNPLVRSGSSSSRSSGQSSNRNNNANNTNSSSPSANRNQVQELDDSSDSDIDIVFEGKIDPRTFSRTRRMIHDHIPQSRSVSSTQLATTSTTAENVADNVVDNTSNGTRTEEDDPKPSTSGLQSNLNLNQLGPSYTDDSDSDYDEEYYRTRQNPFFETEDANQQRTDQLRHDSDDDSIEYVGFVRPKRLRTPDPNAELIELTDDEDEQPNDSSNNLLNGAKKLKTDHPDDKTVVNQEMIAKQSTLDEKAINCRCKVMCKYVCKKDD